MRRSDLRLALPEIDHYNDSICGMPVEIASQSALAMTRGRVFDGALHV
ncbi:MAG: hypothetical protein P8074_15165 [Anaerolineales bacterium]